MSGKYRQLDADETRYMVTGLDAFHYGLETSVFQRVGNWLEVNAFASIGDWRWTKDVSAIIYDDYSGVEMGRVNVYCDGLPVADAPQTQIGASAKFSMPAGFSGCMLISTLFPEIIRMTVSILTGFLAIIFWVRSSLGARIGNVPVHLVSRVALTGICGRSLLMCSFVGIISWTLPI